MFLIFTANLKSSYPLVNFNLSWLLRNNNKRNKRAGDLKNYKSIYKYDLDNQVLMFV